MTGENLFCFIFGLCLIAENASLKGRKPDETWHQHYVGKANSLISQVSVSLHARNIPSVMTVDALNLLKGKVLKFRDKV